nr:reverse transcriptase [Tanacetum cinerariifolium]
MLVVDDTFDFALVGYIKEPNTDLVGKGIGFRRFDDEKKIHLLSWNTLQKDRKEGGLGMRSMRQANGAFLTKLGWRMPAEPKSLWSQVLRSKEDAIWICFHPKRILQIMFIWLALHDRLLSNVQRVARKLSNDPRCTKCEAEEESLDHILRRCPFLFITWNKLSYHLLNSWFWTLPLCEWIMENLETTHLNNDYKKPMKFSVTLQEKGGTGDGIFPATFVAGEKALNDKNGSYVAPILVDFFSHKDSGCFPRRHVAGDNVVIF